MATIAHIERSRLGRRIYELSDSSLQVSVKSGRRSNTIVFELHALSDRAAVLRIRLWRPLIFFTLIGATLLTFAAYCCLQDWAPRGSLVAYAEFSAIFGVAFILAALKWVYPLEVVRISDAVGKPAMDLVREPSTAKETDAFVLQVLKGVRKSKQFDALFRDPKPDGRDVKP